MGSENPFGGYRKDLKLLFRDLHSKDHNRRSLSRIFMLRQIEQRAEQEFSEDVPELSERESLNELALAGLLADTVSGLDSRHLLDLTALMDHVNLLYLRYEYKKFIYYMSIDRFLADLGADNRLAWKIFDEIAYPETIRHSGVRDIRDVDSREEVIQKSRLSFRERIAKGTINRERIGNSMSSLLRYYKGIAYKKAMNYFRDLGKDKLDSLSDLKGPTGKKGDNDDNDDDDDDGSGEPGENDEDNDQEPENSLGVCLDKLGKEEEKTKVPYKTVVILRWFEGKSHKEISKILGISETASTTIGSRAIRKLRNCMKPDFN